MPSPPEKVKENKYFEVNCVGGTLPTKASPKAAGFDLYCCEDTIIPSQETCLVPTGIVVKLPKKCYGRIAERSGIALKTNLSLKGGVIDRDFKGRINIIMYNYGQKDYLIKKNDRIAQIIFEKYKPCRTYSNMKYKRGEKGFGDLTGLL